MLGSVLSILKDRVNQRITLQRSTTLMIIYYIMQRKKKTPLYPIKL